MENFDSFSFDIGMTIGAATICKIMSEDRLSFTAVQWQQLASTYAMSWEQKTGLPAEDILNIMQPIIDEAIDAIMKG